jgi:hypothetical protein
MQINQNQNNISFGRKRMNITQAVREALIPIEYKIMCEAVENAYCLSKTGKISSNSIGNDHKVKFYVPKDAYVFTHNHPKSKFYGFGLSPKDIIAGIKYGIREVRAVNEDGFCHLVEVPNLDEKAKKKCLKILKKYKILWKVIDHTPVFVCKMLKIPYDSIRRKMNKELAKAGRLKFRTLPITEEAKALTKFLKLTPEQLEAFVKFSQEARKNPDAIREQIKQNGGYIKIF